MENYEIADEGAASAPEDVRRAFDHERFKNVAAGVQSVVIAVGLVVGGVWTAGTFILLSGTTKAIAEAQKASAEAEAKKLELANHAVVDASLAVTQLTTDADGDRWIMVEVQARNTGNRPVVLDLKEARVYITQVKAVDANGNVTYADGPEERRFRFDYPDRRAESGPLYSVVLRPGADFDRIHAIQRVSVPGLHLVRFSAVLPDDDLTKGREYGAETYFIVK